jgi:trans-aconitate methyltransferase
MSDAFDADWWEQHYQGHGTGHHAPGRHLVAELADEEPGTALDAGCGTGADAVWLANRGWRVTAVDVSPTAVESARRRAGGLDIEWRVADVNTWEPPQRYDLVVSQYVHPGIPFDQFVGRLADAVADGGLLFVAGHDHADRHSAEHAPADASVGTATITGALDEGWAIEVAETRAREVEGRTMHDVVVKARRA